MQDQLPHQAMAMMTPSTDVEIGQAQSFGETSQVRRFLNFSIVSSLQTNNWCERRQRRSRLTSRRLEHAELKDWTVVFLGRRSPSDETDDDEVGSKSLRLK